MEKISEKIVNDFFNKKEENDERAVLIFGVQRLLEDITKIFVITIIGSVLDILKELLVVFIVTAMYKTFAGGAHSKDNISCLIISIIECLFPIYFSKYVLFSDEAVMISLLITIIFSFYIIIKYAPSDTSNVPILNYKKRKRLKIGAILSLFSILIIFGLFIKNILYFEIAIIMVNLINFNTTNIMYKISKCKRGNEEDI